jgi:hypothetical protein
MLITTYMYQFSNRILYDIEFSNSYMYLIDLKRFAPAIGHGTDVIFFGSVTLMSTMKKDCEINLS